MSKRRADQELPPFDFGAWEGVRGPEYTQFPDELLDHVMPYLSGAEWKVLSYIIRKTFGWKKERDHISTSQLERGVRERATGNIIDRGTGLSRPTIRAAVRALEEKRLIIVDRRMTEEGDAEINCYRLRMAARDQQEGVGKESTHRGKESLPTPGKGTSPPRGQTVYPTRQNETRENATTPSVALNELAASFLGTIGYPKPSRAKCERTLRVLTALHTEGYTPDELRMACTVAASLGARGPELIPHVVGQGPRETAESRMGKRVAESQAEERSRWEAQTAQFEALPPEDQQRLMQQARALNPIVAGRPPNHPLVRAAAIALLETERESYKSEA
ncbi:MAG: replication protein [Armatimonadetes bacterium]|nr:replication protein [Armatimonadota bacterium]